MAPRNLPDDLKDVVSAELSKNLSVKEIAKNHNLTQSSIHKFKKQIRVSKNEISEISNVEQINLPTEDVNAPASSLKKFRSKKVKIEKPEEIVLEIPQAPKRGSKDVYTKLNDAKEGDIEVIELDDIAELDKFEKQLNTLVEEEEEEIRQEENGSDDEKEEAPPVWHDEKFKEVKKMPGEMSEEEALKAILGGNHVNDIVEESVTQRVRRGKAEVLPESEESLALRAKTMAKIHLNVTTFGSHLPWIKNKDKFLAELYKKTTREICDLCTLIETQRSLGNASNQMKHLFYLASQGVEVVTSNYLDMKTTGFSQELQKRDNELNMIFQEIAIDSADTLRAYTTPHARLGMLFASTLFMVDNKNRMAEYKHKMETSASNPGLTQEYKDI